MLDSGMWNYVSPPPISTYTRSHTNSYQSLHHLFNIPLNTSDPNTPPQTHLANAFSILTAGPKTPTKQSSSSSKCSPTSP